MEWTLGAMLFYGGLTAAAITVVVAIITAVALHASKRKIAGQLDGEYGINVK